MQNIQYKQLIAAEHPAYRNIRLNCLKQYPNNFGSSYEEEERAASLKLDNAIKNPDDYNFVFGAFTNGTLIGICGFITDTRLKTQHRGEMVQLFVETAYTRQGIAKKLLELIINKAFSNGSTEQIILGVVSTNESALKLYQQLGFVEYGRLENYFKTTTQYLTQSFLCLTKKGVH